MKYLFLTVLMIPAFFSCGNEEEKQQPSSDQPISHANDTPAGLVPTSTGEPWSAEQLMEPSVLADRIGANNPPKYIYNIGPAGNIPGATLIGATQDPANLNALREHLSSLPKDAEVVVYCGCCPFQNCPNVRPAMALINELGMENGHLLNLSQNLKTNWIDQGYPLAE